MMVQNSNEPISEAAVDSQSHLTRPHHASRKVILGTIPALVIVLLLALAIAIIPRVRLKNELAAQKAQRAATPPNVFVMPAQSSPASVNLQLTGTMAPITEAPIGTG
jgi:flagellar basal body-associated protein FliL